MITLTLALINKTKYKYKKVLKYCIVPTNLALKLLKLELTYFKRYYFEICYFELCWFELNRPPTKLEEEFPFN